MIKEIKYVNEVIQELKENKIAKIEPIDRLNWDTLFYDFVRGKHIDLERLFILHQRIEK